MNHIVHNTSFDFPVENFPLAIETVIPIPWNVLSPFRAQRLWLTLSAINLTEILFFHSVMWSFDSVAVVNSYLKTSLWEKQHPKLLRFQLDILSKYVYEAEMKQLLLLLLPEWLIVLLMQLWCWYFYRWIILSKIIEITLVFMT